METKEEVKCEVINESDLECFDGQEDPFSPGVEAQTFGYVGGVQPPPPGNCWMKEFKKRRLWDLLIPGTHNSAAYENKNFLWKVKKHMICQDLSIDEQLRIGVRYFDFRISGYYNFGESAQIQFWCSHTFLSVPLQHVLESLCRFAARNPSEVVVFRLKADKMAINADNLIPLFRNSQTVDLRHRNNEDLLQFIVKHLGDKLMDNFNANMTIEEILSKGKQFIMLYEDKLYKSQSIKFWSSWGETKDSDVGPNIQKCKVWAEFNNKNPQQLSILATQVTHDKLSAGRWVSEFFWNGEGLKSHGRQSNERLGSWIEQGGAGLGNVNCVSMDFVDQEIVEKVINFNRTNTF